MSAYGSFRGALPALVVSSGAASPTSSSERGTRNPCCSSKAASTPGRNLCTPLNAPIIFGRESIAQRLTITGVNRGACSANAEKTGSTRCRSVGDMHASYDCSRETVAISESERTSPCKPTCACSLTEDLMELEGTRRHFVVVSHAVDPAIRHMSRKESGLRQGAERPILEQSFMKTEEGQSSTTTKERSQALWARRPLLLAFTLSLNTWPAMAMAASPPPLPPPTSTAPSPERTFKQQVLRNVGIGDDDIYYPSFFQGTWDCESTLLSVETPQGEDMADAKSVAAARKQLGYTVTYQARFVPFRGNVVGDRLFTTTSLVESTVGQGVVAGGNWSIESPNRLVLTLRGGIKVENQVTKRSFEASAVGQFDTSEYSRQVFDNTARMDGPPSVKASRNLTRYRWEPSVGAPNEIEAFQRIAMFAVPLSGGREDPSSALDLLLGKPTTVYKYVVRFRRSSNE